MLPYKRTKQFIYDLFNHNISEGTFWNIEKQFSTMVKPITDTIKERIISSSSAGFDESGIRACNTNHWVHVATTDLYSYFSFHPKRGQEGIDACGILPNFQGIAIHDFFKVYLKYACEHAFCNAHILRELISVLEYSKNIWAEMMLAVLIAALDLKIENENIPEKEILELHNLYDKAIEKGCAENKEAIEQKKKGSKGINLLYRLKNHKPDVLRFLTSPEIPFDNNRSERAIRMLKVKVSGCFRSLSGGQFFCLARSFLDSLQKQKIPIFQAIYSIFNKQQFVFKV